MSSEQGLPLRVQGSSRFAFGATTAALITLASGGTAVLVAHGTPSASAPTSLPGGLLAEAPGDGGPVVVARPPGVPVPDPTVEALREALVRAPSTGPRTLVAPLVALSAPLPSVPSPALPVVLSLPLPPPVLPVPALPAPVPTVPVGTPPPQAAPTAAVVVPADDSSKGNGKGSGKARGRTKPRGRHAR
ncbi:MAG: hypothetical protein ACXVGH_05015 [Mycobacteriales bacterium]